LPAAVNRRLGSRLDSPNVHPGGIARYAPPAMALKVYQYSKCSTCRKALAFLAKRGVKHETLDIVTKPPSKAELRRALEQSGLPIKKLFNTSGESYRKGRFGERLPKMTEAEALDALAKDGKLVKRPVVLGDGFALVGFDEAAYGARFR
jgi:arsenate reductase